MDQDVGDAIKLANELDTDAEAVHLARAARIVRKDILKHDQSFKGTFGSECQDDSIPQSLKALVTFILKGSKALFNLGLCILYDRVLSISTEIANAVCERFDKDRVVCPPL